MKSKERIKTLINILEDSDINSMEVSSFWGFTKIKLSKGGGADSKRIPQSDHPVVANTSTSLISNEISDKNKILPSNDPVIEETAKPQTENSVSGYVQKAPLVGTVYMSPKPDEDNFIAEGDKIKKGQVICIIEAMKIFNEIESEQDGTVKTIYLKNEDPVEFGQPLIEVVPD